MDWGPSRRLDTKSFCARIYPAKPGILASKIVTCGRVVPFSKSNETHPPSLWDGFKATREFRNAVYQI